MSQLRECDFVGRLISTGEVTRVETQGSVIRAVDEILKPPAIDTFLAPGFVDLQVNGFAGVDYNDPGISTEQIAASIRALFTTGVTKFFPTVVTGSEERITEALRNMVTSLRELDSNDQPESHAFAGFHVEGPHLSPEDGPRGAHPLEHIRPPDIAEFHRWQKAADGLVKLITISPEWPEMPAYVSEIVRSGVVASVGHTKASPEQIQACVYAGARMSTHLGNAAHATLHKTQNYIWDQLANDRLTASFVVDGIHLPPHFIRASMRAKGLDNCVLVTDAVAPALCQPGMYKLGQIEVELKANGSVVLRGGNRLAGSALRMDAAIGNTVRYAEVALRSAVTMATQNAARAGRIAGRLRGIVPGEKADLVSFAWDAEQFSLHVKETIVAGTSVYRA
jgi:N-acetylglucosamine-6-phosphate deacetylase